MLNQNLPVLVVCSGICQYHCHCTWVHWMAICIILTCRLLEICKYNHHVAGEDMCGNMWNSTIIIRMYAQIRSASHKLHPGWKRVNITITILTYAQLQSAFLVACWLATRAYHACYIDIHCITICLSSCPPAWTDVMLLFLSRSASSRFPLICVDRTTCTSQS
jgi:hypothetical protein